MKYRLARATLITACLLAGGSTAWGQQAKFEALVPSLAKAPGFQLARKKYHDNRVYKGLSLRLENPSTGQQIFLTIMEIKEADSVESVLREMTDTPAGKMPPGSFSGRTFGEQQWHSEDKNSRIWDSVLLITRSKTLIVHASLMNRPTRVGNRWVRESVTKSDILKIEDSVADIFRKSKQSSFFTSH